MYPTRKSPRLQDYDYSQNGAYFVTVCIQNRACLLGEVINGEMRLNPAGEIVQACWDDLPQYYHHIELDSFVIMPNHIHGIIVIFDHVVTTPRNDKESETRVDLRSTPTDKPLRGLPEIMRAFKSFSTRRINEMNNVTGATIWQRNYYDHIIRKEESLNKIREYILYNPAHWQNDDLFTI